MTDAPIVFVHGLFGFDRLTLGGADYFRRIPDALRAAGFVVPRPPRLSTAGSIAARAADLERYLTAHPDVVGKPVHLVAHSMGGLDARFLISRPRSADEPDLAARVLSLATVGTPHHGSPIADLVTAGGHETLARALGRIGADVHGIADLTTDACRAFNASYPDRDGVRYVSVAGRFTPPSLFGAPLGVLGLTHRLIRDREGDNDGLVSVRSATFGERPDRWTFLGVWDVNHFRMINWGSNLVPTPAELADDSIVAAYKSLVAAVVRGE
jgi:triacylglycerol lipase